MWEMSLRGSRIWGSLASSKVNIGGTWKMLGEEVCADDCVSFERVVEHVDGSSSFVGYLFGGDDVV